MPDIGFTHVALPVTNLRMSITFYQGYIPCALCIDVRKHPIRPERSPG